MNYNDTYSKSKNAWGEKPSELLQIIIDDLPVNSNVLDIGSAQGRDSLYLASFGHHVTAIEKSEVGHSQLVQTIAENKIVNINPINDDILNFEIEKNKYFLISLQNILQFLPKEKSLELVREIKSKIVLDGLIAISAFTINDTSYKKSGQKILSYFKKQELLKLFADFHIIYYFEKMIFDKGHASTPMPHYHHLARIIAKKI